MAESRPTTRLSSGELCRNGLLAVAIAMIGLVVAAGFGLTHQANSTRGADPDVLAAQPAPGDHLVAVAAGSTALGPAGRNGAGSAASNPTASGQTSASSSPTGSAPAGTRAGSVVPAEDGTASHLDPGAAVAAKPAGGPAAPDFDRALVELSARTRDADQQSRVDQATRENTQREQDRRITDLAGAAQEIRTEQTRLVDEKNKAEAEAALLAAQQAALTAGQLPTGDGAAIRLPDGTLVRPSADGTWPPAVLARLGQLGRTAGSAAGKTVTPIAKGHYLIGARWGAIGVWASYHTGVDFGAPIGTPVRAAADGTVLAPVAGDWAGTHVIIAHTDGSTLYAHLLATTVRPGQTVKAGDIIGFVGLTGRTFGPHLHFEYYPRGAGLLTPYAAADPLVWLASRGIAP